MAIGGSAVLGLVDVFVGTVVVLVSMPHALCLVAPNRWYGIGIRKAVRAPEVWYRFNAFAAERFIRWSIPILIVGMIALVLPVNTWKPWLRVILLVLYSLAPLLLIFPILETARYARKL